MSLSDKDEKKVKKLSFMAWLKKILINIFSGWMMCKILGVDGNFQFSVEILGF
jgi:hypothetical protein